MAKFARAGFTNPFGKLDDEPLAAFKVPRIVKQALQKQATEVGLPFHEYLREVLTIAALGEARVKDAHVQRIESIAKKLKE